MAVPGNVRNCAFSAGILLAGLMMTTAVARADDDGRAISANSKKSYHNYQQLAADWWNWALQFPAATSPLLDTTGEFGHLGQEGDVWFLAGTFGGSAERMLEVPEGKALFFPVLNSVFWVPEDASTEEDVRVLANAAIDRLTSVQCTIDGRPVKKLVQKHRVETEAFVLNLPEGSIATELGYLAGERFPAVADGIWVLVRPLRSGPHVIHFRGLAGTFEVDVTYYVNVVSP